MFNFKNVITIIKKIIMQINSVSLHTKTFFAWILSWSAFFFF